MIESLIRMTGEASDTEAGHPFMSTIMGFENKRDNCKAVNELQCDVKNTPWEERQDRLTVGPCRSKL